MSHRISLKWKCVMSSSTIRRFAVSPAADSKFQTVRKMKSKRDILKHFGISNTESLDKQDPPHQLELDAGIHALAKLKGFEEAKFLLKKMQQNYQIGPSIEGYHILLESFGNLSMRNKIFLPPQPLASRHEHNKHHATPRAQSFAVFVSKSVKTLLSNLISEGLTPTVHSFNLAIRALVKSSGTTTAIHEVRSLMGVVKPNTETIALMMIHYRNTNDMASANQALREMVVKGDVMVDLKILQRYIGIKESIQGGGHIPTSLRVLLHWLSSAYPDLEFNPNILNTIPNSSSLSDDELKHVIAQSSCAHKGPDISCFNIVITACGRRGLWQEAIGLLETLEWLSTSEPVSPDVITLGATIDACSRSGRWVEALELLTDAKPHSSVEHTRRFSEITPNLVCYNSAIHACAVAGQHDQALDLFWEMVCEEEGVPEPGLNTFESILNMLAAPQDDDERWRDALGVLGVMPLGLEKNRPISRTFQPSTEEASTEDEKEVVYQDVYHRFYAELEDTEGATKEEADDEDEEEDDCSIEAVDWTSTELMFDVSANYTLLYVSPSPPLAHNAVLRTLAASKQWDLALKLLLEMWRHGFPAPDKHSFSTVLGCLVNCNRTVEAIELFRSAAAAGVFALWCPPTTAAEINNDRSSRPYSPQGGPTGWVLDLHGCSKAVAAVALQVALQSRLHFHQSGEEGCFDDLVLVVGKGKHSQRAGSPLGSYIQDLANSLMGEGAVSVLSGNTGRAVVRGAAIESWVLHHQGPRDDIGFQK